MNKLIETGLTYAKQGSVPSNWHELVVINNDTGQLVHQVVEINTLEGWAIVMDPYVPQDRLLDTWPQVMLKGSFSILRMADVDMGEDNDQL